MAYVLDAESAVRRARQAELDYYAPLRPLIIGPRANLHRYAVVSERAELGVYDKITETAYDYPDKVDGSVVDLSYVKVFADDADINYFSKLIGVNGSCQPSSSYPNRVRAANYVFKEGNGSSRSASFYDRDVQIGDVATVSGVDGVTPVSITTFVTGFVGETVAASIGSASGDANNAITSVAAASVTQTANTPINDVAATASAASYESTADGYVSRTYTVTVTTASSGGDATTGRLRVRSSDGLDDADDVVPSAFGVATDIGAKGAKITFSIESAQSSSSSYGIPEEDFVLGQQWVLTVTQNFTAPTATAAGTYTGTKDANYIITVTRGGAYTDLVPPQITVTTDNGYDQASALSITAAATPFAVGSHGVTVAFNQTKLRKGDVYYIQTTAASEGAYKTLVLQDNVPTALLATEVDLKLFVRKSGVEIPRVRTEGDVVTNWTATADGITLIDGIYIADDEFMDGVDVVPMPLETATLYVEYREWLNTGVGEIASVSARSQIENVLGTVDPDNPLAYAVDKALTNTDGELTQDPSKPGDTTTDVILYLPLGGDPSDSDLWSSAIDLITNDEDVYQIVPLTESSTIQDLFKTHVDEQSDDSVGFYRSVWLKAVLTETGVVVDATTSSDEEVVTATIDATVGVSPTVYRTVNASAKAKFVTNGVRAGDVVRINFGTDDFGEEIYDSYTVASVTSESSLLLSAGPNAAIGVARQIEVWRTYTKDELVDQLIARALALKSSRVRYVWPDTVNDSNGSVNGYYLVSALAGLAGSVPSHQGLRNVGVEGISAVSRSNGFFTNAQLDRLVAGGVFVVSATSSGTVYIRGATTTDTTDVSVREEMIVRNADMIRKAVQDVWAPYVGAGNTSSNLTALLNAALDNLSLKLKSATFTSELGPPIANIKLSNLTSVPGSPDKVTITLETSGLPVPLNQIRITLPVTV